MAGTTSINKPLRGIRDSIPGGYVLGRTGNGSGPPILLPVSGFASKGYVANTTIKIGGPAGGDLSGTYPNPVVAQIQGTPVSTTPPTSGQVLEYNGSEYAPETLNSGGVIIGSGVPSALEPSGTLYSRSDAADVYSSQPISAAIVQHASFVEGSGIPGSVTMGSNPVVGNLLIAFISWSNAESAQPTIATGWTQFITITNGSDVTGFALYRYVQAGDTAALPAFCTAGSAYWASAVYEISGVSGTFATDVQLSEGAWGDVSSLTSAGQVTSGANCLALLYGGQYDGSSNQSISSGWTVDEAQYNASNFGSVGSGHQVVATSGTSVTGTITYPGSLAATIMQVIISGGAAGWDLIGPSTPASGANPTATAGPATVNGSATTFMRSDAAPAVQLGSSTQKGIVEVDGTTITATAGVISAVAPTPIYMQAYQSLAYTDTNVGGWVKLPVDTASYDVLSDFVSASNWFLISKTGKYRVYANCQVVTTFLTTSNLLLAMGLNGTIGGAGSALAIGDLLAFGTLSGNSFVSIPPIIVPLTAGDTVELDANFNFSGTCTVEPGANITWMTLEYIGP